MKIVKRIVCGGCTEGYILEDEQGNASRYYVPDLIDLINEGKISVENAFVRKTRYDYQTLSGKGCKLHDLPTVRMDVNDPFLYFHTHTPCYDCLNKKQEPICSACMKANDYRGYCGSSKIAR